MTTAIGMLKFFGMSTEPEDIARKCLRTIHIAECEAAIASITDPEQLNFIVSEMGVSSYEAVLKNPHCDKAGLEAMWDRWRNADYWDFEFLRNWAMHPNVDGELSKKKRQDIVNSAIYYENYITGRTLNDNTTKEELMEYWHVFNGAFRRYIILSKGLTDEDCCRLVGRNSSEEVLVAFADRMHIDD